MAHGCAGSILDKSLVLQDEMAGGESRIAMLETIHPHRQAIGVR
jgi:hypothetical protein